MAGAAMAVAAAPVAAAVKNWRRFMRGFPQLRFVGFSFR
jgi:hypothetical protein